MFGLGHWELLIVAIIVLLLFGNRLPSVMRSLGRGVVEFKKGVSGIEDDIQQVGQDKSSAERPREPVDSKAEAAGGPGDPAAR